jgi:hypothetical protein
LSLLATLAARVCDNLKGHSKMIDTMNAVTNQEDPS